MSKVLAELRRRKATEYAIGDATVWLRAMTFNEIEQQTQFSTNDNENLRVGWAFGCSLTDSTGEPLFPKTSDEPAAAYAERIVKEVGDIPSDVLLSLSEVIQRINREAKTEAIRKNS